MVVGSDSTDIQLFNLRTNTLVDNITGHKGFIYDLAFTGNSAGVYSLSFDRTIRYYDINAKNSTLIKRLQTPLKTFALSPDETFLIGGSSNMAGQLVYLDLRNLEERVLFEDQGNRIHAIAISPDGASIAFGDEKGIAHIWDLAKNEEINTLRGHTARINDIEFSHDGTMLATGSYDGSVQLYVMENLDELPMVMKDHATYVWDVSFSSDGDFLVSATNSNIIKIWPTKANYFADRICANVSRNMTDQEWQRYVPNGINYKITCLGYNSGDGGK
jgi:WD40 repeat protein